MSSLPKLLHLQIMRKREQDQRNSIMALKNVKTRNNIKKTMSIGVGRSYSLEVEAMTIKELLQLLGDGAKPKWEVVAPRNQPLHLLNLNT